MFSNGRNLRKLVSLEFFLNSALEEAAYQSKRLYPEGGARHAGAGCHREGLADTEQTQVRSI